MPAVLYNLKMEFKRGTHFQWRIFNLIFNYRSFHFHRIWCLTLFHGNHSILDRKLMFPASICFIHISNLLKCVICINPEIYRSYREICTHELFSSKIEFTATANRKLDRCLNRLGKKTLAFFTSIWKTLTFLHLFLKKWAFLHLFKNTSAFSRLFQNVRIYCINSKIFSRIFNRNKFHIRLNS